MNKFLVLAIFLGSVCLAQGIPEKAGYISVKNPAFLTVQESEDGVKSLVMTSFGLFSDSIRQYEFLSFTNSNVDLIKSGFVKQKQDITKISWPNQALYQPSIAFGQELWLVATGFFPIPWKSTGEVAFYSPFTGQKVQVVSTPKKGWFYHQAISYDMNQDGLMDIVAARANKPLLGDFKGEIVWFENQGNLNQQWKEHLIKVENLEYNGIDVAFKLKDLNQDALVDIIATEFGGEKLSVLWNKNGKWEKQIIDDQLGKGFDLEFVDLNLDGKEDLLVTNHEPKAELSKVFAYEIPENPRNSWIKHILMENIPTNIKGAGQASPGKAISFTPYTSWNGKPYIAVSGDGSKEAYILIPQSHDVNDWDYDSHVLIGTNGIVGQIAAGDMNNDGLTELYVPAYSDGFIHVFSY